MHVSDIVIKLACEELSIFFFKSPLSLSLNVENPAFSLLLRLLRIENIVHHSRWRALQSLKGFHWYNFCFQYVLVCVCVWESICAISLSLNMYFYFICFCKRTPNFFMLYICSVEVDYRWCDVTNNTISVRWKARISMYIP